MTLPDLPKLVSVKEAAELLAVSKQLVYRLFHAGELRGFRVRSAIRLDRHSLLEYLTRHAGPVTGEPEALASDTPSQTTERPSRRGSRQGGFRFVPR